RLHNCRAGCPVRRVYPATSQLSQGRSPVVLSPAVSSPLGGSRVRRDAAVRAQAAKDKGEGSSCRPSLTTVPFPSPSLPIFSVFKDLRTTPTVARFSRPVQQNYRFPITRRDKGCWCDGFCLVRRSFSEGGWLGSAMLPSLVH